MNGSFKFSIGCAALLAGTVAFAEPDAPAKTFADEPGYLTVYAPRVDRRPANPRDRDSNEQIASISHRVSYAGLDLAMHADVLELRRRIVESAQTACEQLAVLSPLADLDTPACVREAIDEAMARARQVVAAAMAAYNAE